MLKAKFLISGLVSILIGPTALAQGAETNGLKLAIVPMTKELDSIYAQVFRSEGIEVVDSVALRKNLQTSVEFNSWYRSLIQVLLKAESSLNRSSVGFSDCPIEKVRELSLDADLFTLFGDLSTRTVSAANGRVVHITYSQRMLVIDLDDGSVRCLCDETVRVKWKKDAQPEDYPDTEAYHSLATKLKACAGLVP